MSQSSHIQVLNLISLLLLTVISYCHINTQTLFGKSMDIFKPVFLVGLEVLNGVKLLVDSVC